MVSQDKKHFTIRADEGQSYFVIGDIITVKLTAEETTSAYLMVEVVSQPGGGPWFLHTHEPQETFTVLDGVFEVYGQDEHGEKYAIRAEVGDSVHVPAHTPHGFKNVGDSPGRMLLTYEPAEPMLNFFKEVGIPMSDRKTIPQKGIEDEQLKTILEKYMTIVESPF